MAEPTRLTGDRAKIEEFLDKFDVFLFDCDGVLWSGDTAFAGASSAVTQLRARGKTIIFVTNNSTKSRADYEAKLNGVGIAAKASEVFGSSFCAATYIARVLELPADKRSVFVVGEAGLEAELAAAGLRSVGGTDAALRRDMTPADFAALADGSALDPAVGVVLQGLDFHFNYLKLATAAAYLQRGATFLATNTDSTLPMGGALFPGAGSLGAPLARIVGKEPLATGKPSLAMLEAVEREVSFDRSRACMVGDRLDTDIKFGLDGGLGGTLLVLTGVARDGDWRRQGIVPAYVADKLADIAVD